MNNYEGATVTRAREMRDWAPTRRTTLRDVRIIDLLDAGLLAKEIKLRMELTSVSIVYEAKRRNRYSKKYQKTIRDIRRTAG